MKTLCMNSTFLIAMLNGPCFIPTVQLQVRRGKLWSTTGDGRPELYGPLGQLFRVRCTSYYIYSSLLYDLYGGGWMIFHFSVV